jgi:hypothetical protein
LEEVQDDKTETIEIKLTSSKASVKGILLGEHIKLLDNNFKEIKDISNLNEHFVEIVEISDTYHKIKPSDDYCQEFKYVRIKATGIDGYVDGRKIYKPVEHSQNKIVKLDNYEVSFVTTNYFGIGVSDDDGLTGCMINTPVVFTDNSVNYEGLVKMVKNDKYEGNYPYFELKDDEGAYDEIVSIDKQSDKYL